MPNPPKYIEHGALYLVTSRTEEGLPFADEQRFKMIAESIMARAQELYPVEICDYDVSPNHFHMMLVPINPTDFPPSSFLRERAKRSHKFCI
jgi:REP element-mobilizing transposase RayT